MPQNPLLEPGDDAPPSIPRDEPETAAPESKAPEPAPEPAAEEKADESGQEARTASEKAPDDAETKYSNVRTALRQERAAKSELQQQLAALQERVGQFDTLKGELEEYRRQRSQQQERDRFDENPAEYLRDQTDTLTKRVEELVNRSEQANQEALQQQQFLSAVQSQTRAFANETPDYNDALSYMHERRLREYAAIGVPESEWENRFNQESLQFAAHAMQQGRNPAEMVYELAGVWGYARPKAQTQAAPEKQQDAIERLEAGHRAAATLSDAGRGDEQTLLKSIDSMSDQEFDEFWNTQVKPNYR